MSTKPSEISPLRHAEIRLREVTFHVAYHSLYAAVTDTSLRFAYAIIYSTQPIQDRRVLMEWWEFTKGKSIEAAIRAGNRPPPRIQVLIDAWREAKRVRAELDRSDNHVESEEEIEVAA